ncbi:hypothetical protein [Flagellimonas okinawensis]|uniref:Cytochrome C oxidase subunit I n=1 Tax=Flagellimonas okinawensis TaxID=3031324 RepID=A0ABT5XLE9_9FLAO|nr:hypothetical protein [[Muricauda] okinawensis]MDF0706640.1 hypothetical protein [[Muricauda] okinawensis]
MIREKKYQHHLQIALGYFIIAALLGMLLRSYPIFSFKFNYRYMVHAHSHIALLGWVYLALTTLLHYCFVNKTSSKNNYKKIFWGTQITLVGMLLTFPFQGYGLFSIIFSTLFLIASYIYTYHFWKSIDPKLKESNGLKCVKVALAYMVISSLGPWALGIIMNTLGAQSIWYRLSIYFYLHFQYNGWMILALVGLFVYVLELSGQEFPKKGFNRFFLFLNLGVILTFFLSTLWTEPSLVLYILAGLGAVAQLYAFAHLWGTIKSQLQALKLLKVPSAFLKLVIVLLMAKIVLQLLTAFPYFAVLATTYIDLTIGYLHLTFLGIVSIGLFFFMDLFGLLRISKKGFYWYLLGFMVTELLLFYKGIAAWQQWSPLPRYPEILAISSLCIPIGLLIISIEQRRI